MTTDFIVNPHDPTIVDVWLGDTFLGELHPTATGFRLLTPGKITVAKVPTLPIVRDDLGPRPLASVDVTITPEV